MMGCECWIQSGVEGVDLKLSLKSSSGQNKKTNVEMQLTHQTSKPVRPAGIHSAPVREIGKSWTVAANSQKTQKKNTEMSLVQSIKHQHTEKAANMVQQLRAGESGGGGDQTQTYKTRYRTVLQSTPRWSDGY